nr:hypothetical protein [Tanacetum cinerariifolium]
MLVQVYVDDIIFGSIKKSRCDEFKELMKKSFQMSSMGKLTCFLRLQVKEKEDGIFISHDKYVPEILKKFDFVSVKTASTPIGTQPDIMFVVCACSRFQVTPKTSHLQAVKRIFRYLKGQPKLGLWYPKVSSFDLEAYSDSDYARANLDRKSTTEGCQFLGRRFISWQCKKQTIMATSTTEEEYVTAAHCYFTVISNPLFDEFYGPSIPIHILEEERTKRDHADYIKQMKMLFTINPRLHNPTNNNTNFESFSSFQIPNQESEPRQEEIDVVSETNDVLPPSNDDSDDEVDVDGDLRVDNVIQNSEHEYSESEDSDLDNPLLPLPPPEPPDKEFDFEKEISVERNLIVKFECIDARMKFDVENDVFKFIMFSLLSAESGDTIFDPGISD